MDFSTTNEIFNARTFSFGYVERVYSDITMSISTVDEFSEDPRGAKRLLDKRGGVESWKKAVILGRVQKFIA